jgi:hypothetical protein
MLRRGVCAVCAVAAGVVAAISMGAGARADGRRPLLVERSALAAALAPARSLSPAELALVVDELEALLLRDEAEGSPSPELIAALALLEPSLDALPAGRAEGLFVDGALAVAALGAGGVGAGPELPARLEALGGAPAAFARSPRLGDELALIGRWAEEAAARRLRALPPAERALREARLDVSRGRYRDAIARARYFIDGPGRVRSDPRWPGWAAAARILDGADGADGAAAAAGEAGGRSAEGGRVARAALLRRSGEAALEDARTALRAMGSPAGARGAPLSHVVGACRRVVAPRGGSTTAASAATAATAATVARGAEGEALVACARLLWRAGRTDWVEGAAARAPATAGGAALRAGAALVRLLARPRVLDDVAREELLDGYLEALAALPPARDPVERPLLGLLGLIAVAPDPQGWRPTTRDEEALLVALERVAPCAPSSFAVRAFAVVGDRPALGALAARALGRCAALPDGLVVAVEALSILTQLAEERPRPVVPALPQPLLRYAMQLVEANPRSADAAAALADVAVLEALALDDDDDGGTRARLDAIEQAAVLLVEAIALTSPAGDPELRRRLEANLAFVSLTVARALPPSRRRLALQDRAEGHLRQAAALGQTPAVLAVLLDHHVLSTAGAPLPYDEVARLPWGRERGRLACLLGAVAQARGDRAAAARLSAVERAAQVEGDPRVARPELSNETTFEFEVLLEKDGLRPHAAFHSRALLVPRCEGFADVRPAPGRLRPVDDDENDAVMVASRAEVELRAVRPGDAPGGFLRHLQEAFGAPPGANHPRQPASPLPSRTPFSP